jgi:vacuolar-type H+-ATPase subunit F/Vma7
MNQIALLADNTTVTCFKLAGITNVFPITDQKNAKKILLELMNDKNLRIILITKSLLNEMQIIEEISEHQYPIIIPIPEVLGKKELKIDLISEMIKRKTGIEIKF